MTSKDSNLKIFSCDSQNCLLETSVSGIFNFYSKIKKKNSDPFALTLPLTLHWLLGNKIIPTKSAFCTIFG